MINRTAIIAAARGWLGTPYRHQASLKGIGCDCLGLVRGVWRDLYGAETESPPAYTPDWAEAHGRETLADAASRHMNPCLNDRARPGDLILFRWRSGLPAKHAAILTEADHMIHAHDGAHVAEVHVSPWWRRRIAFAFQFPDLCDEDI